VRFFFVRIKTGDAPASGHNGEDLSRPNVLSGINNASRTVMYSGRSAGTAAKSIEGEGAHGTPNVVLPILIIGLNLRRRRRSKLDEIRLDLLGSMN
jgi:hypothetical protein